MLLKVQFHLKLPFSTTMTNEPSQLSLNDKITKFCQNMTELETMTAQFADFYSELMDQPDNRSNLWSKLDSNITYSFANASLYWLYLLLKGSDLQDHAIKEEISRVRKYMQEFMLLKKEVPKLNVKVAQSFVRNALFDHNEHSDKTSNEANSKANKDADEESNKLSNRDPRQHKRFLGSHFKKRRQ